jgi:hypothetical protein
MANACGLLESIGILHTRYLSAIRPLSRKLRYAHSRRPRLRSRCTAPLRRRNSLLCAPQDERRVRRLGRHLWCGRRTRSFGRTIQRQGNRPPRHRHRSLFQERYRHGKRRRTLYSRGWHREHGRSSPSPHKRSGCPLRRRLHSEQWRVRPIG